MHQGGTGPSIFLFTLPQLPYARRPQRHPGQQHLHRPSSPPLSSALPHLCLCMQVGPKDVEANACVTARRDRPGECPSDMPPPSDTPWLANILTDI